MVRCPMALMVRVNGILCLGQSGAQTIKQVTAWTIVRGAVGQSPGGGGAEDDRDCQRDHKDEA